MSYQDQVDQIARAVLYEGYLLYPYRPSAVKNQQRWTFGGIYPRIFSEAHGQTDPWRTRTEILIEPGNSPALSITVRFLRLLERTVGKLTTPQDDWSESEPPDFAEVESLTIDGRVCLSWQEATEQVVEMTVDLQTSAHEREIPFHFPATYALEPLRASDGLVAAVFVRRQQSIDGALKINVEMPEDGLCKTAIEVQNLTPVVAPAEKNREQVLIQSLISAHTIMHVEQGDFISLLEAPDRWSVHVAACRNERVWPVLVGEPGAKHTMLSSPIILYDYPQIAPESPGDFFDATEIDEMLTLRIMTMTDEEKEEMSAADERGRALLERTESLAREQMMNLHGTVRELRRLKPEEQHG